jgi:hypothetical protein
MEKFAGSDRQILPGYGQIIPPVAVPETDTGNMNFR